ncbi:MAG: superoxide dismutase family protein [Burkholderiaceae bacterium]|nr:superoxide dismutase family protein [Burkholderiaceae bacterium]
MHDTADSVGTAVSNGWNSLWGSSGNVAVAEVKPTQGNTVSGKVEFKQSGSVVRVKVDLAGFSPGSMHGFHVHERGDCSSADGMSAGGHFNPEGVAHGSFDHPPHHAGDLPNLTADDKGQVHTSFEVTYLSVGSGGSDVAGRSVVVHRDADDFKSQPAGNSGPRLACGVIVEK